MRIRDRESPLTRLRDYGPEALSDHELVALLTGNPAHRWLHDGLRRLAEHAGAPARLQAAFELGRRVQSLSSASDPITSPSQLVGPLIARYGGASQEHLGAVYLDSRHRLIRHRELYVGTVSSALVSTREVFKVALELNASALLLFHNHPSGDPHPSREDITYTNNVIAAGKVLEVSVLDHLIIGRNRYHSMSEHGLI